MATSYSPKIVTDGLVMLVDPNHPRCWDGSSSTITDLASGLSLTKGSNTTAGYYNGQRVFATTANSGAIDTGYRYGSISNGDKVVDSAGSWTISGWMYKNENLPNNWWHVFTDGSSGDILTVYNTNGAFRTSMNNSSYNGTFSTGGDVTDYGVDWDELEYGWVNVVLIYNQASSYLQLFVNNEAQSQQTGRVINSDYKLRNFYGWGSAQSSYHTDADNSHTTVYNKVLTAKEIAQNYNALKSRFEL
tara:strand:- start:20 stop:757 length:738 start_codon:yes stop_codon:yes gene_type:complete